MTGEELKIRVRPVEEQRDFLLEQNMLLTGKIATLEKENAELKERIGISVECDKAQKNGELCLGYGGDEDEPCEQCKNCIKCECGYYQLGETEKDEQLTKAKELLERLLITSCNSDVLNLLPNCSEVLRVRVEAEQFLNSKVEK